MRVVCRLTPGSHWRGFDFDLDRVLKRLVIMRHARWMNPAVPRPGHETFAINDHAHFSGYQIADRLVVRMYVFRVNQTARPVHLHQQRVLADDERFDAQCTRRILPLTLEPGDGICLDIRIVDEALGGGREPSG